MECITSPISPTMQDTVEALQEQLRDLRLGHRRELRLKAREAAAAHEELQAARAKVRELNTKARNLQSVRLSHLKIRVERQSHAAPAAAMKSVDGGRVAMPDSCVGCIAAGQILPRLINFGIPLSAVC